MDDLPTWLRSPFARFINYPVIDLVIAGGCFYVFFRLGAAKQAHGPVPPQEPSLHVISGLEPDTRRAVYQTVATLSGTLLGLVLTSVSILTNLLRTNLADITGNVLTPRRQRRTGTLFFAAIRALALALIVSLAALLLDSGRMTGARWPQAAVLAAVVLVTLRLTRVVWVLSRLVPLSIPPSKPANPPITDDEY